MAGAGYKLFNTGDVLTAAQVNTYLQEQTVMVFASSTARTTALSGVLAEGMVSYLQDTNAVEVYNGSAWVGVSGAGDVTEVQAGTGISVASGTGPIPVVTNTMATAIDAKGDLVVGTGADTFSRLAVGGTNGHVLQVDSSTATGLKWAAAGGGGPYAAATIGSNQTLSAATLTKLNFDTESWDSDNCYDTTNKRFTPTTAGKYTVTTHVAMYDGPEYRLLIYKNGAQDCLLDIADYTINDLNPILQGTKTISMNGSTDYLEIYGFMRGGSTRRVDAGGSWFQISYVGA